MNRLILLLILLAAIPAHAANTPPPGVPGELTTNGGSGEYGAAPYGSRTVSSGSTDTALATDGMIIIDTGSLFTETIPAGTVNGQTLIIEDGSGTAQVNPITLVAASGTTIGGSQSITLSDNSFGITLKWDNLANWIVTDYYAGTKSFAIPSYLLVNATTILGIGNGNFLQLY